MGGLPWQREEDLMLDKELKTLTPEEEEEMNQIEFEIACEKDD